LSTKAESPTLDRTPEAQVGSSCSNSPSETSNGSLVKMPQPRKARASTPATPASKAAAAVGPPSLYLPANNSYPERDVVRLKAGLTLKLMLAICLWARGARRFEVQPRT